MKIHLSRKSRNVKTGNIPVSTSSSKTCPKTCPFNNTNEGGCYAASGPLGMHWAKVTAGSRGLSLANFAKEISNLPPGQLWRHNQAGDLPGNGTTIDLKGLTKIVTANINKKGFTYTHYPTSKKANRDAIAWANSLGFTINLSGNNLDHADELRRLNIAPVVTVLPSDTTGKTLTTKDGNLVVVCPATYRDDVTCKSCGLCQKQRKTIVGFPAHGVSKKRADKIAQQREV